jgi:hypothetical protein
MMRVVLLLALVLATASCGAVRNTAGALGVGSSAAGRTTLETNGVRYRARTTADREDRRSFTSSAGPTSPSLEGAVEAAVYQATRYCLLTFGGSDTEWITGPDTAPENLPLDGDLVTLTGRCTQK